MLNSIIRLSLTHRTLVLAACVVVLAYGGYLTTTLPIDVFPDLDRPRVVILTECPGMSSEEVETLVTYPIETAILGANGVEDVRSQSSQGMNVIYIEFSWKTEPRYARQIVSERLANVPMPPGIRPIMTPQASIMGQILHVGIHRRKGPQGGKLTAVGQTGLLAERTGNEASPELTVWNPVNRNDLSLWKKIEVENPKWDETNPGRDVAFVWNKRSYDVIFPTPL
ncbi:MAG TPA: CusA/CzcA family heavy metal efflux RND transporter, partial [Planctomycetaceae bacterium]|nr:CusA/CzcA family heavy metal efflux RND transporter [Planctomycetaceae bacterium]